MLIVIKVMISLSNSDLVIIYQVMIFAKVMNDVKYLNEPFYKNWKSLSESVNFI